MMFGGIAGSQREFVGREMSIIVPPPIAGVHPRMLQSFLTSGEQHMTGGSKALFAQHRDGFIFPIFANVQPVGDAFLVAAEEVPAPDVAFALFLGEGLTADKAELAMLLLSVSTSATPTLCTPPWPAPPPAPRASATKRPMACFFDRFCRFRNTSPRTQWPPVSVSL